MLFFICLSSNWLRDSDDQQLHPPRPYNLGLYQTLISLNQNKHMIEKSIQELTEAVNRLCVIIETASQSPAKVTGSVKPTEAAPAAKVDQEPKKKKEEKPAKKEEPPAADDELLSEEEPAASEPEITDTTIRDVIRKAVTAGKRAEVIKLLKDHGSENVTSLDAKHYKSVYKAVNALL